MKNDATFIVFNCGDSERIGIRDRKTQTLYLSELIDPINCQDPIYGKLHLGLHLAIIQDLIQREEQKIAQPPDTPKRVVRKRAREDCADDDIQIPNIKHRRLRKDGPSEGSAVDQQVVVRISFVSSLVCPQLWMFKAAKAISTCKLALISLDYGPYHSPSPSAFIRLGPSCFPGLCDPTFTPSKRKVKYSSSEYFHLALSEPMAEGAIGIIHRATAIATLPESGSEVRLNLLVKLALENEQCERLRHEYAIYQHMASASEQVEGIVFVHGFYEDAETGVLALLMDDGGTSLMQREQLRTGLAMVEQIQVSDEERYVSQEFEHLRHSIFDFIQ